MFTLAFMAFVVHQVLKKTRKRYIESPDVSKNTTLPTWVEHVPRPLAESGDLESGEVKSGTISLTGSVLRFMEVCRGNWVPRKARNIQSANILPAWYFESRGDGSPNVDIETGLWQDSKHDPWSQIAMVHYASLSQGYDDSK